jgi:hypothetical protein
MKGMKKHVSVPGLLKRIRSQFAKIPETVGARSKIPLADCLMSGLAIFGLKIPSLLQFDEQSGMDRVKHNLKSLYGIEKAPCDTYVRERLDEVQFQLLRKPFNRVFAALQRQKVLERFEYYEKHYLISLDGTGCFSSHKVNCESCCVKNHKDGSKTYYHQMLAAVLVHPDEKTVIPLAPEPILKQDGNKKNDCERNAAKRLLEAMRREHPHLKMIIVEDALYANAPHIKLIKQLNMRYIIGVKPDDHAYLFEFINAVKMQEKEERDSDGTIHRYRWFNGAPLNDANADCEVNFLDYEEISPKGEVKHFTWITDIPLMPSTVKLIMKGGRARWKIENETFNTLKNQGYHFEHNYGHGYNQLSTVMAMLMFLAFLVDQAQETRCELFQRALKKVKRRTRFWQRLQSLFLEYFILSWETLYEAIANDTGRGILGADTS